MNAAIDEKELQAAVYEILRYKGAETELTQGNASTEAELPKAEKPKRKMQDKSKKAGY